MTLPADEYERRVHWDAARQIQELRNLLGEYASVAEAIDWIYRPALEELEWRLNMAEDFIRKTRGESQTRRNRGKK